MPAAASRSSTGRTRPTKARWPERARPGDPANWHGAPGFWTTIGDATLKYHAWGDGFTHSRVIDYDDGFTVWYQRDGVAVGVLTHNADHDYDLGEQLIVAGKPAPVPMG